MVKLEKKKKEKNHLTDMDDGIIRIAVENLDLKTTGRIPRVSVLALSTTLLNSPPQLN